MGQAHSSRDHQSDNDYYQPNTPNQQDNDNDNISISSNSQISSTANENIKQINRLYGWSMIESMTSTHHSLTPRSNNTREKYMQNNQLPPTTTKSTVPSTATRFSAKKQTRSADSLEGSGKQQQQEEDDENFISLEEQQRQRELEELLASSASTTTSILNYNDLNNDKSVMENNRVRRSMAIHAGKHYSISLGDAIHERLQNELKNHDEANNEKGQSAPIGNENSIDNYYKERSGSRLHHRRSSSIDSNISNMINNELLNSTNQITPHSPPNQPSELLAGSLVHEMTFIEEEMDPVENASWNGKHRDIAELWNSIPKSFHAGINRVYHKLKIRFKNDIDISDYQIRQMAIDLGFPNFLYEYMFSKLERTVFSLLHDEYILKKKKNKNRRNNLLTRPSSVTTNEYVTTQNVTPNIPNVTAVLQSHVVEFKTLPSSPALPRTDLLNRLFNDEDIQKQEPSRLLSSFEEYININQDMVFEKGLKIKLIITEVGKSPGRIRTAASPIISRLKVFDQFGWFHTSFSIGNLRFDWTNSGYCAVTTVKSATSLLAITVKEISTLRELESIIKLLSIEISRWNRNFSYTNLKGNISKETGSCQTFTIEMMKVMGVSDLTFAGNNSIHNFLQDLLTKGDPITKFSMNEDFKKKYSDLIDTKIEQCKAVTVVSSRELILSQNNVAESSTTSTEDVLGNAFAQQQQAHFEIKKQQSAKVKRWEHFKSQYFTSNKKHIIFNSHRELDHFVLYLKELSRWNTENLKQLDHLYTQSYELNTTKKTLSSTYQEIAGRYNLYTQAYGVTNEGSQIRLDTNTSSALNGLRQTIQEVHANLSDATTKLKQTSNQISLIMYQLGLIENLLIKVVNTQRFATNYLRYGNLVTNNIPQRLFVLDDNFEIEREMRSLIDMPSKNDLIDICFFKLTSRHIIEKFKSRIERGDSYLLQLKHIKEDIQSEIKSQQLASSEERKKHALQMIKQMQQRLRNTITSGQHSNYFCTQIHQFVQKFLNSPVNTTVGSQKLQDFLKALTEKVISMIKINLTWYQVYEVLESMTFEYTSQTRGMIMYDCSLCQVRNEMKMMDEGFYAKCLDIPNKLVGQLLLESKNIDEKDLHDNEYRQFIIDEEIVKFKEEYKVAIDLIRTISEDSHDKVSDTKPYSPFAKLNIITLAAKEVMNRIYSSKTKQPLKSDGDQFVSADDFVPVFICVICVAAIKDMFTQIGFIKEFAYQDYLNGEQGFFLSSLESASFYIVNYDEESYKQN